MQSLSTDQLDLVSGGYDTILSSFNPCSVAVIKFLKYRNDFLESLLAKDTQGQALSAKNMRDFQAIAVESCTFEELKKTGAVGSEIFLY